MNSIKILHPGIPSESLAGFPPSIASRIRLDSIPGTVLGIPSQNFAEILSNRDTFMKIHKEFSQNFFRGFFRGLLLKFCLSQILPSEMRKDFFKNCFSAEMNQPSV